MVVYEVESQFHRDQGVLMHQKRSKQKYSTELDKVEWIVFVVLWVNSVLLSGATIHYYLPMYGLETCCLCHHEASNDHWGCRLIEDCTVLQTMQAYSWWSLESIAL